MTDGLQSVVHGRLQASPPDGALDGHLRARRRIEDQAAADARALAETLGPFPAANTPAAAAFGQVRSLRASLSVPVLMYHRISSSPAPGLERSCVSPDQFEAQLHHLRSAGHQAVTPDDLLRFTRSQGGLPPRPVMLTFDDGYSDFAAGAWPRLRRLAFSAVVFAVTDRVGDCAARDANHGAAAPLMTWRQLRELGDQGVAIESHSDTHRPLTRLPIEDVYREAIRSRAILEQAMGRAPTAFCYPFGAHDPATDYVIEECGYALAFTTTPGLCRLGHSPLRIPRIEVRGGDDTETFARKLGGSLAE